MSAQDTEMRSIGFLALGAAGGCIYYAVSSATILPKSIFFGILAGAGLLGLADFRQYLIKTRETEIRVWRTGHALKAPIASDAAYYAVMIARYLMPSILVAFAGCVAWYLSGSQGLSWGDTLFRVVLTILISATIAIGLGDMLGDGIAARSTKLPVESD